MSDKGESLSPKNAPPSVPAAVPSNQITYNLTQNIHDSVVSENSMEAQGVAMSPPLPPEGLPPGWTQDQCQHYGEQYLSSLGNQ